jgi:hypothetical protein
MSRTARCETVRGSEGLAGRSVAIQLIIGSNLDLDAAWVKTDELAPATAVAARELRSAIPIWQVPDNTHRRMQFSMAEVAQLKRAGVAYA